MPNQKTNESSPPGALSTPLLDSIDSPADLKGFTLSDLEKLAKEIRSVIISTASHNGGHLAAHLGVVELTIALHYVYNTEKDRLVWDVGHQSYAHKLLTGRRDRFHTVRAKGGLSPYPKRSESVHDAFGTGHSSTSISAALGMALARDHRGTRENAIAVIGDGAMTGGMAFEALAHAGDLGTDLLVVLNDNKMSISPNVGALSAYFNRLISNGLYSRARQDIRDIMERTLGSGLTKAAQRLEHSVKGFLTPGSLFEELGFRYIGPVDGHHLETLIDCLKNTSELSGPVFFHCVTQKGKGYAYAEEDPQTYHGVKAFNIDTGEFETADAGSEKPFTDAFADALVEFAREDDRIVGITAAMPTGTGLGKLQKAMPDRFYDVGICEQHAVTLAAGLAAEGFKPVCAIYSSFMQRAFDQYVHDVCMQNLPVVFAVDRAGAVGEDSPTHQGAYDLSFLRCVPNATVLAPRDDVDTVAMLRWALDHDGPTVIRYARAKANTIGSGDRPEVTRGQMLREGDDLTLLAIGPLVKTCLDAAEMLEGEELSIGVGDARVVKPIDGELLDRLRDRPIITVEENTTQGGFGTAVFEYFERQGGLEGLQMRMLGFPDVYMPHATRQEQLVDAGLDVKTIAAAARDMLHRRSPETVK